MDGVATRQKRPRKATLVEPELLESDSGASEEIEINPTTLQKLREITRPSVGLSEKETLVLMKKKTDRAIGNLMTKFHELNYGFSDRLKEHLMMAESYH